MKRLRERRRAEGVWLHEGRERRRAEGVWLHEEARCATLGRAHDGKGRRTRVLRQPAIVGFRLALQLRFCRGLKLRFRRALQLPRGQVEHSAARVGAGAVGSIRGARVVRGDRHVRWPLARPQRRPIEAGDRGRRQLTVAGTLTQHLVATHSLAFGRDHPEHVSKARGEARPAAELRESGAREEDASPAANCPKRARRRLPYVHKAAVEQWYRHGSFAKPRTQRGHVN